MLYLKKNYFACFDRRLWYGSDSATGGWVFPHSSGRHFFPCACCRLQWICHLRYRHFCRIVLDVHVNPEGFIWRLSQQRYPRPHLLHYETKGIPAPLAGVGRVMQSANVLLHTAGTHSCIIKMHMFAKVCQVTSLFSRF